MARVNIEDCWWTDPRRDALNRMGEDADGLAMRAWKLAQDFWKNERGKVPLQLFQTLQGASKLIQVGLARVEDDCVYVCGSSAYLDWIHDAREAAKRGGQKSAQRPRDAQGKLLKLSKCGPSESQVKAKQTHVSVSSSVSDSASFSDSVSESEKRENEKKPASPNASALIAVYCESWKLRYKTNPEILGKHAGIAKRLVKDLGEARSCDLVRTYLAMEVQWFLQRRHDLATFEANLNAVVQKHDTGGQVSNAQARGAEAMSHAHDQLRRIAAGEL